VYVVETGSINAFENLLGKYWINQYVVYDFKSDLTGTAGLPYQFVRIMLYYLGRG